MSHQELGLFFLVLSFSLSLCEHIYMAIGGDAVLTPRSPPSNPPYTSIEWQYNKDIAADRHGDKFECFRQFIGRCEVNSGTGALTIKGLKLIDSGTYKPEINYKVLNDIQLSVISPVAKPSVKTSCNTEMTSCDLTCEGNTAEAEPITYKWFLDGKDGPSDKVLSITKDSKESSFGCLMKNPVSNETSESITNPFTKGPDPLALIFGIGVPLLVVIVIGVAAFLFYKCRVTTYELTKGNNSTAQQNANEHLSNGTELKNIVVHNQQTSGPPDTNRDSRRSGEGEEGPEEEKEPLVQPPDSEGKPKDNQHLSNGAVASGTQETDIISVTQNGHSGAVTEVATPDTSNQSPEEAAASNTDQETEIISVEVHNPPASGPLDTNKDSEKSALVPDKKPETNCEPSADEQDADDRGHVD